MYKWNTFYETRPYYDDIKNDWVDNLAPEDMICRTLNNHPNYTVISIQQVYLNTINFQSQNVTLRGLTLIYRE